MGLSVCLPSVPECDGHRKWSRNQMEEVMVYNPLSDVSDDNLQAEMSRRGLDGETAIREYVVGVVARSIDNTASMYEEIREETIRAVREDMGAGWDRGAFVMMLDGRGQTDRWEVADVVGRAVCDMIRGWIVSERDGRDMQGDRTDQLLFILDELVDMEDQRQRVLFGEHFMPQASDWPEDE